MSDRNGNGNGTFRYYLTRAVIPFAVIYGGTYLLMWLTGSRWALAFTSVAFLAYIVGYERVARRKRANETRR